jgi:hypothetical protein
MDKNILHLILILLIISILIKLKYESFTSPIINLGDNIVKNNAICFITRILDPKTLEFAESCTEYNDVYIVVDDNDQKIDQDSTSKVKIIRMDNTKCTDNKYIRSTSRFNLDVTGWDKAFYYFCKNNKYNYVWFIEDDVFIPNSDTLYNIDIRYPSEDLLIRDMVNITNNQSDNQDWLNKIKGYKNLVNTPVYWTWVCAMRCSKKLLNYVNEFSIKYNQLYFHEMMIPSIVKNNDLSYSKISELSNIIYRKEFDDKEIVSNPTFLYHPIKDYDRQHKLRMIIKKS